MSFFDWFKTGPKAAEKILDGTIKGLDALVLTNEEKEQYAQKAAEAWLDAQKVLHDESSIRSVTRRLIALLVMVPYIGLVLACAVALPFNPEYSKFYLALADGKFGLLALAVVTFYFGPYMIGRAMGIGKK